MNERMSSIAVWAIVAMNGLMVVGVFWVILEGGCP